MERKSTTTIELKNFVCTLPFFDLLEVNVLATERAISSTLPRTKNAIDRRGMLVERIRAECRFRRLTDFIEETPWLLDHAKQDIVKQIFGRTIKAPSPSLVEMSVSIVEQLAGSAGLVELLLVRTENPKLLTDLILVLASINELPQDLHFSLSGTIAATDPNSTLERVHTCVVKALLSWLRRAADEFELEKWMTSMQILSSQMKRPQHMLLHPTLSQHDMLFTVFRILRSCSDKASVMALLPLLLENFQNKGFRSLEDATRLLLEVELEQDDRLPAFERIVEYFLSSLRGSKLQKDAIETHRSSVEFLLRMCDGDLPPKMLTFREPARYSWYLWQFRGLLLNSNPDVSAWAGDLIDNYMQTAGLAITAPPLLHFSTEMERKLAHHKVSFARSAARAEPFDLSSIIYFVFAHLYNYEDYATLCKRFEDGKTRSRMLPTQKLSHIALSVAILRNGRVLRALSDGDEADKKEDTLVETIRTILRNPDLPNMDLFFMAHLPADTLRTVAKMNIVNLDWMRPENIEPSAVFPFTLPSFVISEECVEHTLFSQFSAAVETNDDDAVRRFLKKEGDSMTLRTCLVVLCYTQYFRNGKVCPFVQRDLENSHTSILVRNLCRKAINGNAIPFTDREIAALRFLSAGPQQNTNAGATWREMFESKSNRRQDGDMADLMVLLLAVALGSRPESTHVYDRIFTPEALHRQLCPGSSYERLNYDCGFVTGDGDSLMQGNPAIMGEHRKHRLALNSITWMSLNWASVLYEPNVLFQLAGNHFFNYASDEARDIGVDRSGAVTAKAVKSYIATRAAVFKHLLEVECREVNASLYLTESILQLWRVAASSNLCGAI
ncbi:hypothetical protein DFJ73DRAFT_39091 [Zopfochytrium polystomum]|nr:hypothetical protein DFJ73DRAFT_39091 [Zopfochytrium polystomum]